VAASVVDASLGDPGDDNDGTGGVGHLDGRLQAELASERPRSEWRDERDDGLPKAGYPRLADTGEHHVALVLWVAGDHEVEHTSILSVAVSAPGRPCPEPLLATPVAR